MHRDDQPADFPRTTLAGGEASIRTFPLHSVFRISRGARTEAQVVEVVLRGADGVVGRGECTPYTRYGETHEGVVETVEHTVRDHTGSTLTSEVLRDVLPAGSARNGLDAALWDLACKSSGRTVAQALMNGEADATLPETIQSVDTVVLDEPDTMREAAAARATRPILKVKLDGERVVERMRAVRDGAPDARLIVDANEAWSRPLLDSVVPDLHHLGVEMIEQPLPAGDDAALEGFDGGIVLCADESCHTRADLAQLRGRYSMVNIKLDKTGGLTEALDLLEEARASGFAIMVGCMVSTSLGIAPAWFVAARGARYVDLDGPAWLEQDRDHGLVRDGLRIARPTPDLWG